MVLSSNVALRLVVTASMSKISRLTRRGASGRIFLATNVNALTCRAVLALSNGVEYETTSYAVLKRVKVEL